MDSRNGRQVELAAGGPLEQFAIPLSRPSRDTVLAWGCAWADPVRETWTPADRPILVRWIDHYDRAARALRRADRKPVVIGGNGQVTEHPSYGTAMASLRVVQACEQQLGFGALNRAKLGLTLTQARKSLDDLNAGLMGAGDDDDPR